MTDTAVCHTPIYTAPAPEYISPTADKVYFEDGETLQYKYDQNTLVKVQRNVTVNIIDDLQPSAFFQKNADMTYSLTVNVPKNVTIRLFDPTKRYPKPSAAEFVTFEATEEHQEPAIQDSDTGITRALYKISANYSLVPVTESVTVGDYLLVFSIPDPEFEAWQDGSKEDIIIPYQIKAPVLYYTTEIPELVSSFDYTGSRIDCKWKDLVPSKYRITGDTFATAVGTYTVTVSPPVGKHFEDSTETSVTRSWEIKSTIHYYSTDVPQLTTPIPYTGSEISAVWETPVPEEFIITGNTTATAVGTYTITVSTPTGYKFEDINSSTVTRTWEIAKRKDIDKAGCLFDPDNGNLLTNDGNYWDVGDYSEDIGAYTPIRMVCECLDNLLTDYDIDITLDVTPDYEYVINPTIQIYTVDQAQQLRQDHKVRTASLQNAEIDFPVAVISGYVKIPRTYMDVDIYVKMTFSCKNKQDDFITAFKTHTGVIKINSAGIGAD